MSGLLDSLRSLESAGSLIAVGVGVVLLALGNAVMPLVSASDGRVIERRRGSGFLSRLMLLMGAGVLALGVYAGLRGPVRVGPVVLRRFSFIPSGEEARARALSYVRAHVHVSRSQAVGWHGAHETRLHYSVRNSGDRGVAWLMLRFHTGSGTTWRAVDVKVRGTFPPGTTRHSIVEVPPGTRRDYFQPVSPVPRGHIVGARF